MGPIETRQKTPTCIYAGYAIQNLGKLWQLWLKIKKNIEFDSDSNFALTCSVTIISELRDM